MVSPKKQDFFVKNQHTKKDFFLILLINVSSSKIGHDFSNKVVRKIDTRKKIYLTKTGLQNWYSTMKEKSKKSVDFWPWKYVPFLHFLSNCYSSTDLFKKFSFEYVDSLPKILLLMTHHLWNSTSELILLDRAVASGGAAGGL